MGQTKQNKLPRGVMIRKHKSGETINISFTFKGVIAVNLYLILK
ncbi:Uncharacterised protein [Proteus mirabilis]|nr:Uncharacterised protein [Proteus mirabilis]